MLEAAVEIRPGREVDRFAAPGIQALVIDAGRVDSHFGIAGPARGSRASKDKQHGGMIQEIPGARDRKLRGRGQPEPDSRAVAGSAQAKAPGLDIHATVPEMWLGSRDFDVHWAV